MEPLESKEKTTNGYGLLENSWILEDSFFENQIAYLFYFRDLFLTQS